jgi:hypothetical protein
MRTVAAMFVILLCMTGCTWRQGVATTVGMVAGAAVGVATGADFTDASTSIEEAVASGLGETIASESLGDTDESVIVYVQPAPEED